ncbi:MAG: UvrB/UvrC motif-containing protein, partial [Candidatus Heimdallarchaeota archaeon]
KSGEGVITKLVVLMNEETSSENFEGAAIIRDRIQAIKLLFTQKAIPVVLEKYHTEVKRVIGQKTNYLEIIEKILANNTNGR